LAAGGKRHLLKRGIDGIVGQGKERLTQALLGKNLRRRRDSAPVAGARLGMHRSALRSDRIEKSIQPLTSAARRLRVTGRSHQVGKSVLTLL
jgi:hypothetical protein